MTKPIDREKLIKHIEEVAEFCDEFDKKMTTDRSYFWRAFALRSLLSDIYNGAADAETKE